MNNEKSGEPLHPAIRELVIILGKVAARADHERAIVPPPSSQGHVIDGSQGYVKLVPLLSTP